MMKTVLLTSLAFLFLTGCCQCGNIGGPKAERQQDGSTTIIDKYQNTIDCPLCDKNSKMFHMELSDEKNYLYRHYICENKHYTQTIQLRSQSQQYIIVSGQAEHIANRK